MPWRKVRYILKKMSNVLYKNSYGIRKVIKNNATCLRPIRRTQRNPNCLMIGS